MNRIQIALPILIFSSVMLFAGCNTKDASTTADLMRGHADDQEAEAQQKNEIAKDWDKAQHMITAGKKDVHDGEAKVKSGEKDLKDGRAQVLLGNNKINEGNRLSHSALQRFKEAFPGLKVDEDLQSLSAKESISE